MTLTEWRSGPAAGEATTAPFGRRLAIGGYFLQSSGAHTIDLAAPVAAIKMASGREVTERIFRGAGAPLTLRPRTWALQLPPLALEGDRRALLLAEVDGVTVTWYIEQTFLDTWIALAGQTQFSLSRRAAYREIVDPAAGLISHASHPPRAWLDGAEQVVVTGSPSTGEVQLPDTAGTDGRGAQWRAVTTPALTAGQVLTVEYMPVHDVAITPRWGYPAANELTWSAQTVEERLTGRWD